MTPSNIICVTAPIHRWADLGARHHPDLRTPYLDALEKHGLSFGQAVAASADPQTNRSALLNTTAPDTSISLPQQLADAGYQTGFTGAWDDAAQPIDNAGFNSVWQVKASDTSTTRDADFESTRIGDYAVRFLQDARQPFFLYVSFGQPRHPFDPPPPWSNLYNPARLSLPPELRLDAEVDEKKIRAELARYYALLTHLDNQIGRVLATLSSRAHTNNVVIYSGLRGFDWTCDAHHPSEANIRIPLILSGAAGQRHGETENAPVSVADLPCTIRDLCGLETPADSRGLSLATHLFKPEAPERMPVTVQWDAETRFARNAEYKLIESTDTEQHTLFHVQNDPNETENLFASPKHIVDQVKLQQVLQDRA